MSPFVPTDKCVVESTCCQEAKATYGGLEVEVLQRAERKWICQFCGAVESDSFIVEPPAGSDVRVVPTKHLRKREPS